VLVTVPVFALLGLTDEPATLDGYGPIPASMARKLLTDGANSFTRVLIDPRDGAPLEIGRTSYRLTKAMRQGQTGADDSTAEAWCPPEWLESAPPCAKPPWEEPPWENPPCEEPGDDTLIDADDIAPYDPVWDDFYAMPIVLPPDPEKDMALENWDLKNRVPVMT
jgi:hypothetical protein